ncbi:MAG: outer membrane protein assembly factor BamD [Bacteroidales bacterium]|nr:outer membrane protein assembly factor BamD [Bacteroidales bacterium]MBP5373899.1 outer membrane protein assembly factor BamD [Bacteroidales bacterium]
MRFIHTAIAAALVLVAVSSCKSQYEVLLASNDADAKYAAAMEYFQNKKFSRAAQLFESLSVLTNGTERDDTVQYYWGLSNYRNKDFYTAESNFAGFVKRFPLSPFAPDAQFYRLDCLYRATYRWELDQNPTRACLASIMEYEREHPGDAAHLEACRLMKEDLQDRLDRKDFEAGKQYYRMEDYLAAHVKLRNVLKNNSENHYREDVLYYTAMSSYHYARLSVKAKQKERYLTFQDDYLNFIGEYPESKYRSELDGLYRKVQSVQNF